MARWCLTKQTEEKLLNALRKDGNPQKMVDRGSEGRHKWFENVVGKENASNVNAFYESRMLLKNQRKGLEGFIKGFGAAKEIKTDFLSRVERLDKALSKRELDQFLDDYIERRLGVKVTNKEIKILLEMSEEISNLRKAYNPVGDTKNKLGTWASEEAKTLHGGLQQTFDNYVETLRFEKLGIGESLVHRGLQFKSEFPKSPVRATAQILLDTAQTIASTSVQLVATFDDSFLGRQGIMVLLTGHPKVWGKAFAKSVSDMVRVARGRRTTDALKADLFSDPLYMNGEYRKAGILNLAEEQYPVSFLSRIPVAGRGIRIFEEAFVNGSLRMRSNMYRIMRQAKVDRGIALTDEEIKGSGNVANSLSAKGNLGKYGENPVLRLLMWAPKMLKADFDVLTAHSFQNIPRQDRIFAIQNLIKIVTITSVIESVFYLNNKEDTELNLTATGFLDVKGFGFLRGMPKLIVLMARLLTGQYKTKSGETKFFEAKFGKRDRLDAIGSFLRGKAPPATGGIYDILAGQDFYGNKPTFSSLLFQRGVAISLQNLVKIRKDPSMDTALGWVGEFFGLNADLNPEPNIKSKIIPEGKPQKESDVLDFAQTYAEAILSDPETSFNRMFTGQRILRTENGAIIVERMDVSDSQAYKRKYGADTKQIKLDHTIPLELGGSNDKNNLKLVSTYVWSSYTKVENALGRALKKKKISKDEAQRLIKEFKAIENGTERKEFGQKIINKYK